MCVCIFLFRDFVCFRRNQKVTFLQKHQAKYYTDKQTKKKRCWHKGNCVKNALKLNWSKPSRTAELQRMHTGSLWTNPRGNMTGRQCRHFNFCLFACVICVFFFWIVLPPSWLYCCRFRTVGVNSTYQRLLHVSQIKSDHKRTSSKQQKQGIQQQKHGIQQQRQDKQQQQKG